MTLTVKEWRNSPTAIANVRRRKTLEKKELKKFEEKFNSTWVIIAVFVFALIISIPLAEKNFIGFIVAAGLIVGGTLVLLPYLIKVYIRWKSKKL